MRDITLRMERSVDQRIRILSRAGIPRSVALNDYGPLYFHRMRLLAVYGLHDVRFFADHLNELEQSGRAKAMAKCDILDRLAVTDSTPGEVRLVKIERPTEK